jgi:hypothetical protein
MQTIQSVNSRPICNLNFEPVNTGIRGPSSSFSITTGYGLDGPEIESRWGRDFPHLARPALGPTQLSVQ